MDEELLFCPQIVSKLLSPSYVVFGKVIFSLFSVCLFTGGSPCDHYSWHHSPVWDASTTIDWFKLVHLGPLPVPSPPPLITHTHTHTHTHYVSISKWAIGLQLKGFLFFKWFQPKHQQIKRHGNLPVQFSLGKWGVKSRFNPKVFHKKFLSLQIWLRGWGDCHLSSKILNFRGPGNAQEKIQSLSEGFRGIIFLLY